MKRPDIPTWASQQPWHLGYQHVANLNGMSYKVVYFRAIRLGIPVAHMKRGRKFGSTNQSARKLPKDTQYDWSLKDSVLAKQHGVTRQRINQLRFAAAAQQWKQFRTQEA